MAPDTEIRDRLLGFEIGLDRHGADRVVEYDWGTAFLNPSLPHVWDASWLAVERPGLAARRLAEVADEVLGGAGFEHRTLALCDEADGARLRPEFEALPGWEMEATIYMAWKGPTGREATAAVREERMEGFDPLRRALIAESLPGDLPELDETVGELVEMDRRLGLAGGDRWFLAPAEGEPASACRLLVGTDIVQVEEVATLESERGKGLAQSVMLAALEAAQALGPELIFLSADADDWPKLMYERLGFETVGTLRVARRYPEPAAG